jgi:membrane-bound metal-dependent hydrolase YbcI (DUF457 family)
VFIGHFALGLAAKRAVPRVSLATLFAAAVFADLLWPVLVAAGVEQVRIVPGITAMTPLDFVSYPYSHSLLMLVVWGVLFGWICARGVRDTRVFGIVFGLVVSHWLLDYITHRPDMPLYPGGPKVGLGLWNHPTPERGIEIAMYAIGAWIYLRATRARDGVGRWGLLSLAALLLILFLANSTPPPSVTVLWMTALAGGALTLAWSHWADGHRVAHE